MNRARLVSLARTYEGGGATQQRSIRVAGQQARNVSDNQLALATALLADSSRLHGRDVPRLGEDGVYVGSAPINVAQLFRSIARLPLSHNHTSLMLTALCKATGFDHAFDPELLLHQIIQTLTISEGDARKIRQLIISNGRTASGEWVDVNSEVARRLAGPETGPRVSAAQTEKHRRILIGEALARGFDAKTVQGINAATHINGHQFNVALALIRNHESLIGRRIALSEEGEARKYEGNAPFETSQRILHVVGRRLSKEQADLLRSVVAAARTNGEENFDRAQVFDLVVYGGPFSERRMAELQELIRQRGVQIDGTVKNVAREVVRRVES